MFHEFCTDLETAYGATVSCLNSRHLQWHLQALTKMVSSFNYNHSVNNNPEPIIEAASLHSSSGSEQTAQALRTEPTFSKLLLPGRLLGAQRLTAGDHHPLKPNHTHTVSAPLRTEGRRCVMSDAAGEKWRHLPTAHWEHMAGARREEVP